MSAVASPSEVREAGDFLRSRGVAPSHVSPRKFANAKKESGKSFSELLNFVARLLSGGQGQGPAPEVTKGVDILKPENAVGGSPLEYADAPGLVK